MKKTILHLLIGCFSVFQAQILHAQQTNVDSLQRLLKQLPDDSKKIKILNQIGRIIENDNLDSAKWYYQKALGLSEKIKYTEGILDYYDNYTYLLDVEGKNDSAMLLKKKALKIALAFKNLNYIGNAYSNIANTFFNRSQYDSSLKYNQIAMPYIEKSNDVRREILFKANIALIYEKLKNYDKAKEYLDWAVKKARTTKQEYALMTSLSQLAVVLSNQNKYKEAEKENLEALALAKKLNNLQYLGFCYLQQAEIDRVKKNIPAMKDNLLKAIDVSERLGYIGNICSAKTLLGLAYMYEKNLSKAKEITLESYNLAVKNKLDSYQQDAAKFLMSLAIAKGNNDEFNKYNDIYNSITEKINLEIQSKNSKEFEAKYESEKKERQILKLESEKQKQNSLIYSLIAGILVVSLVGFIGYRNINYRRKLAENEITALQKEKQLTATESIIKGQEEERSRLAKDLHDGLGGILSSLKYSLTSMTGNFILTENSGKTFTKALETLETAISEMRRVAHSMMPEALLKFGLNDAILNFCEGINQHGKLQINFQAYGLENRLEQSVEITIFRIVQELLNNAMKHSEASKVLVQLTKTNETLVLTVEDNGKGFDKKLLEQNKGAGISNIESRVSYLNGQIEIDSNAATGTSIIIEIPIKKV